MRRRVSPAKNAGTPQPHRTPRMTRTSLDAHIAALDVADGLKTVLTVVGQTCAEISRVVAGGAWSGPWAHRARSNVQDEEQKKLDVITDDMLTQALLACPAIAGVASEEKDAAEIATNAAGEYLALFDPLDGSSNIDINAPVGTIVSVLKSPRPALARPTSAASRLPATGWAAALCRLWAADHAGADDRGWGEGLHPGAGWSVVPDHDAIAVSPTPRSSRSMSRTRRHWAEPCNAMSTVC